MRRLALAATLTLAPIVASAGPGFNLPHLDYPAPPEPPTRACTAPADVTPQETGACRN